MRELSSTLPPDRLSRIVDALPIPDDAACVYVSGSIIAGWAHRTSDLDTFVVTREPVPVPTDIYRSDMDVRPARVPTYVTRLDGLRQDVEFWLERQVDQILRRCERPGRNTAGLPKLSLSRQQVEFVFRLTIGVPLTGPDWLETRQEAVRASPLRSTLVSTLLDLADALLDDTIGQLDVGDTASAVLTVREALGHLVDTLTVQQGMLTIAPKWRAQRVQRCAPTSMPWDEYWRWETMRDYDPDHPAEWVRALHERLRELTLDIAI